MSSAGKFQQLREKTDRDLMILIGLRPVAGFLQARAGRCADAERACAEAGRLLPVVDNLRDAERVRAQSDITELRRLLDEASVPA